MNEPTRAEARTYSESIWKSTNESPLNPIDYGYFVFLSGSGPLAAMPIAWFCYDQDAKDYAARHGSADYPCVIKPKRRP